MKILYHPVFVLSCILFLGHQVLEKLMDVHVTILDNYLDNLVAVPIILTLVIAERCTLFRRGENYRMDLLEVVLGTVVIALIGEVLFPRLSDRFTFDWMDFVFYAIGSVVFYFTVNRSHRGKSVR